MVKTDATMVIIIGTVAACGLAGWWQIAKPQAARFAFALALLK
jgi:hypothetical protein